MTTTRLLCLIAACTVGVVAPGRVVLAQDGARLALEASRAQSQGNLDQALTLLGEALADARLANDRRAVILADRGALLARLNQPKAAIDDLNRAVLLYAEYPAIYNNRGSILLTLGLAREAIKDFDRAILLAPGYVAAYNNRAGARMLLGQSALAIADFTKAIQLSPENIAPIAGRGRALLAANRPQAALRDFTHVLQADNRLALGYRNRAEARLATERTAEAIEDLSRAIAFEPTNPAIYLERGRAYVQADNFAAAIKDYSRALELDAQSGAALEARALAFIRVDAANEADADIQRALEINPRSARALAARALLYLKTGQPDLARREIDRALKLAPQQIEVLLARGQIDEATTKREDAVQAYRAALAVQPTAREAGLGLSRLTGSNDWNEIVELRGQGIGSWRVFRQGARTWAASDEFQRLRVPIDAVGEGAVKLASFEIMRPPNRDIAVLRFGTGTTTENEVVQAAIIDLGQGSVLGVVPEKQGTREAKWSWEESRLVITAADGLTDEFQLRGGRGGATNVAGAQSRRQFADGAPRTYDAPGWLPWTGAPQQQRRPLQQRQQKPKTLFDMIFGN